MSEFTYQWGSFEPFEVQRKTVEFMVANQRGYVLNGLGTGKTYTTLSAFATLKSNGYANRMLVICPLSTTKFTWAREVLAAFPNLSVQVLYGTKAKRIALLEKDADIYIINHDGVKVIEDELMWRRDIDVVAVDELAAYRNGAAKRTKRLRALVSGKPYAWGLTGAPMPRAVTDVWGQASIITPDTVPKYFSHFRHTLCYKDGPFRWEPKIGAVELAVSHMQPSIRYSLDDVTELPEQIIKYVPVAMGVRQAMIYNTMRMKAIALIDGHKVDALNAGAVLSKLLQISLGWVYARDGSVVQLDNALRVHAVLDYIDMTEHKALVLLPFKHALAGISKALTSESIKHFVVSGDTLSTQRNRIFDDFQNGSGKEPLIAHPACLAHGITLTAADTVIWGGPVTSLEIFLQTNARIRRIGQKHKQQIFMIGGTKAEKKLYTLLGHNDITQTTFLDLVASATEEVDQVALSEGELEDS